MVLFVFKAISYVQVHLWLVSCLHVVFMKGCAIVILTFTIAYAFCMISIDGVFKAYKILNVLYVDVAHRRRCICSIFQNEVNRCFLSCGLTYKIMNVWWNDAWVTAMES